MGVLAMSACLVALYFALATTHVQDMLGMLNLRVYRAGASIAWHRGALYDDHYAAGLPFTYPPFAALFFVPLAALPLALAKLVLLFASIGAIGVACWAVTGVLTDTHKRLAVVVAAGAIALWLEPVQQTLKFGQVNLLLMVLIVVDIMYSERRWSGVGVGIAATLKLTPLIFVPYLLFTGRRQVAATRCSPLLVALR